jgi:arylsulfatase A-like enzyme
MRPEPESERPVMSALGCETRAAAALAHRRRPNVLFVMADQWRAQAFGCAGDPNAHTPAIDAFAAQSVDCEQAIAGYSLCCPARASLVTGQYPLTHGVLINDVPLHPQGITLGEAFRNSGYATGYIGKWHLHGSPGCGYERREAYIPPESRCGFEYWKVAECSHDYGHSFYYEGNDDTRKYWEGYDAHAQTRDACRYIAEHAGSASPYFLVLSWGPPHDPYQTAPEQYQSLYRGREILLRPNVPGSCAADAKEELRGYCAHAAALDDCFAELLAALRSTGTADDTIVVFTSDHGDMLQSQGLQFKALPWEESLRIPLLIRYPRVFGAAGHRFAGLINTPDVMPTLLALTGIPVPAGVQGSDYWSPPQPDRPRPARSALLTMPVSLMTRSYGIAEYRGVRTERYTYVRASTGPWLLYDHATDPYEMRNLCGRAEAHEIQAQLEAELVEWLARTGDEFLPGATHVERAGLQNYLELQRPIGHVRSPWGDWQSTLRSPVRLSTASSLKDLLTHQAAREILRREIPHLLESAELVAFGRFVSLRLLESVEKLGLGRYDLSSEKLNRIEQCLEQL